VEREVERRDGERERERERETHTQRERINMLELFLRRTFSDTN